MRFAGVNYFAVVIAAVVAWFVGAGWYMTLGKTWMAALGITTDQMEAAKQKPGAFLPYIYAFVAELIMAWVLAGVMFHVGPVTLRSGLIAGLLCWLGFVITTTAVNYSFGQRDRRLILIDGGHWLLVLLVMGAIIGAIGR
jgi:hypothetical protein